MIQAAHILVGISRCEGLQAFAFQNSFSGQNKFCIANALLHSFVIYVCTATIFNQGLILVQGWISAQWVWGTTLYLTALVTVLGKAAIISDQLWTSLMFWLTMIGIPVLLLTHDSDWKSYKCLFRPEPYHILQEIQKYNLPDYRPRMEQFQKPPRGTEEGQEHLIRAYDTSVTPGGKRLETRLSPIWTLTVVFYGFYELLFLGSFWRVYKLGRLQHAWMGIQSFNGVVLFVGGWVISWSGLQALAIAITIVSNHLFDRYINLRGALIALQQSLNGRVPTLIDSILVQKPAEAFAAAGAAARACVLPLPSPSISMLTVAPSAQRRHVVLDDPPRRHVIAVGLALARKLRRQIRESVELLVHADAGLSGLAHATGETSSAAPAISVQIAFMGSAAAHDAREPSLTLGDASSGLRDKRKSSMTNSEVRNLALQRREGGGVAAARAQAKKVLALQKATRDLQAVTGNIAFISTCLLEMAIWVAHCSGTDKTTSGQWDIEGTALPAQWLYTVAVTISLSYLTYNAVLNHRRLVASDKGTFATPALGQGGRACRNLICNFAKAGSVERSVTVPEPLRQEDEDRAGGEAIELATAGTGSPPKDPLGEEEVALYPLPLLPRVLNGARTPQGPKSWMSLRSEHSGKSGAWGKKLGPAP
ncbi:aminophospholipid translocase [Rhodotorula kratochvilovae]